MTPIQFKQQLQDGAIQETMGAILDRSIEHLGAADAMIIPPPGVDNAGLYRRRGVQLILAPGADWLAATTGMVSPPKKELRRHLSSPRSTADWTND